MANKERTGARTLGLIVLGVAIVLLGVVALIGDGEKKAAPAPVKTEIRAPTKKAPRTYEDHMVRATKFVETQPERALSSYQAALKLRPGDAEALFGRGLARLKLRDAVGAIRDLEGALEAQPTFADAVYLLGEAKRLSDDKAGARVQYERYLELDPQGRYAEPARGHLTE